MMGTTSMQVANSPPRRRRVRRRPGAFFRRLRGWRRGAHRAWRTLNAAPRALRIGVLAFALIALFAATNFVYHVLRKPTELFFPVSGALNKTPSVTWQDYASSFREYSTAAVSPELLAALAQVEGAGNPIARTYWRWRFSWHPFAIYEPASSAVGMYQMTDAAFAEARRYCVRGHSVIEDGCWSNGLYTRVLPSHAIELTAAFLDRNVATILAGRRNPTATAQQKQDLAAIIHLCGAGPARAFARRGFHLAPGERCGDHDVATYLREVNTMKRQFLSIATNQ